MNSCAKPHFISSCVPKCGSLRVIRKTKVVFVDHESGAMLIITFHEADYDHQCREELNAILRQFKERGQDVK